MPSKVSKCTQAQKAHAPNPKRTVLSKVNIFVMHIDFAMPAVRER